MNLPPARVPWPGFWLGSFDGADALNAAGVPLDLARATGHLDRLDEDHRRAAQAGLTAVRETVGWRVSEDADGRIDLARVDAIAASARRHGLAVLWTLMQHGVPAGLSLHDDRLVARLARFAEAVARMLLRRHGPGQVYTPIDQIGFVAWAAAQWGWYAPPNGLPPGREGGSLVCGYAIKRRLARAALEAVGAIRAVDPQARFVHVEPLLHVVPPRGRPQFAADAAIVAGWQWQVWDLLSGRAEPALGGRPDALDIVGVSHYPASQWELITERRLDWSGRDPRRRAPAALLDEAWRRYGRPLVVAATGHEGVQRAPWLHAIAAEVRDARARGVPVEGLAPHPFVDQPDWHEPRLRRRSGLWHVDAGDGARSAVPALHDALARWRAELPQPRREAAHERLLVVLAARRWDAAPPAEQPVLEALAAHRRIVVVEPPRHDEAEPRLEAHALDPALDLLVPHLPPQAAGRPRRTDALVQELLRHWLDRRGATPALAWPLDPARLRLARAVGGHAVCTLAAPVAVADLRAHRIARRHGRAGWLAEVGDRLHGAIGRPRVGCIEWPGGERIDVELLVELADTLPEVQVLIVGDGFDRATALRLRRPNIHLLPLAPRALLPALVASWSAVLRPLRRGGDGAGLVDALATRLPVIASGAPEAEDAERLGVLRADGAVALAMAVRAAILEDTAAARRRRRASAAFVHAHDAARVAERIARALDDAGALRRAAVAPAH